MDVLAVRWLGELERIRMRLKNILIVVEDIEASKKYYHGLFGLDVILDNGGNMILTEGLVLQEKKYWKQFLGGDVVPKNNHAELYFEERNIEEFVEKLERLYPNTEYVNRLMTRSGENRLMTRSGENMQLDGLQTSTDYSGSVGRKVIRFYDPDGNLIEVGTPM